MDAYRKIQVDNPGLDVDADSLSEDQIQDSLPWLLSNSLGGETYLSLEPVSRRRAFILRAVIDAKEA